LSDQFLIRKRGAKAKAHLWTGADTVCRMWSTGGLKQESYEVRPDRGLHETCHMCAQLAGSPDERHADS
jgi:hypothetical protein